MVPRFFGFVVTAFALAAVTPVAGQGVRTVPYTCAEGRAVSVTYGSGWADVVYGGRSSRLNAAPSTAGSRYSDGRWVWRTTGPSGTLARDGRVVARNCLPSTSRPAGTTTVRYACTNGMRIQAVYSGNVATVTMRSRRYVMYQTPAASGVRYAGGGYVWWTKGPEAFLTTSSGQMIARSCRAQ